MVSRSYLAKFLCNQETVLLALAGYYTQLIRCASVHIIEPPVLINHFILEVPPSSRGEPSRPVARPFGSTVGMGTLDEASVSLVFIDFAHAIGIRRADTEVCPYRRIAP
jgi:hypothetical protein